MPGSWSVLQGALSRKMVTRSRDGRPAGGHRIAGIRRGEAFEEGFAAELQLKSISAGWSGTTDQKWTELKEPSKAGERTRALKFRRVASMSNRG
jgi:hypothetical protein